MESGGCGTDVEPGEMAIGSVVGIPVAEEARLPVVTVPVGSWIIKDVGNHDCESVMVAVATILVTRGFEDVEVEVDVGVIIGVEVTSEIVVVGVSDDKLVDGVGKLDGGTVELNGTDVGEDVTDGGVDVGIGISVVLLDGI